MKWMYRAASVGCTIALLLAGMGGASQAGPQTPSDPGEALPASGSQLASGSLLDRPAHGEKAIARLGAKITKAAARNDVSVTELKDLLRTDLAAWVATDGRLFYIDPVPEPGEASVAEAAPFPYDQTFLLHSTPGSSKKIFLDFNGHTVSGTAWNTEIGVSTAPQPALDLGSDDGPGVFSNPERDLIQSVWQRVSEDFAPFDVDVTTADPGSAALRRTNAADTAYGMRVLVTPSQSAAGVICSAACGGVAYLDVFDDADSDLPATGYYQPAWVFPHLLGDNPKSIAEAVSHEVGHTLGLNHDGTSSVDYSEGHEAWAPIMGVGYARPISQWSRGEYADANNPEDDLAVIGSHGLTIRPDEHGGTIAAATALGAGTTLTGKGVITRRTDKDYFSVVRGCAGSMSVTATPSPTSPNLDVQLKVFAADGTALGVDNPVSAMSDTDTASGMSADLTVSVPAGTFLIEVDGVGALTPATSGYSDYGSLGTYTMTASGCGEGSPEVPTNVSVTHDDTDRTGTISWEPPTSPGNSPIIGYLVKRDGVDANGDGPQAVTVPATASAHTFGALLTGTTTLSVAALNAGGTSPPVSGVVTLPAMAPGVPTSVGASTDVPGGSATLTWAAPVYDGGSLVTGYTVTRSGAGPVTVPADQLGHTFTALTAGATYTISVAADNAVGQSEVATRSVTMVAIPPGPPTLVTVEASYDGQYAFIEWQPPVTTGDSPITGYVVERDGADPWDESPVTVGPDDTAWYFGNLDVGTPYELSVSAVNNSGAGAPVTRTVVLVPPTGATAPRSLNAVAGDRRVVVSWLAPSDAGTYPVDYYELTTYRGTVLLSTEWPTASTRSFAKTGLTNGTTYSFEVRAVTMYGVGVPGHSQAVTPRGRPGAPGIGQAISGAAGATITAKAVWTRPTVDGGSPITGYRVTALRMSSTGAVLSQTVSGLRPATSRSFSMVLPRSGGYRFTVQSVNAIGASVASARSNKVTGR